MAAVPKYKIIEGSPNWAGRFREFCRLVYRSTYPRPERGITVELFSREIFNTSRVRNYFNERCTTGGDRGSWLAIDDTGKILGVVAAQRNAEYCEMQSFYVDTEYQGQGIGHSLYQKVLEFALGRPIQVDVVEYMDDTIAMYEHWGFKVDTSKGRLAYNIPEWPEEARRLYQAIYMVKPAGD